MSKKVEHRVFISDEKSKPEALYWVVQQYPEDQYHSMYAEFTISDGHSQTTFYGYLDDQGSGSKISDMEKELLCIRDAINNCLFNITKGKEEIANAKKDILP